MTNFSAQQRLGNPIKKKQNAVKALNNFLNQLKIHFDFNDNDIIKVLELMLKEKKHENFTKKWWHILK